MSWIEERLSQRKEATRNSRMIADSAPKLYESLWACISSLIGEAKANGFPLETNGFAYERTVFMTMHPSTQKQPPKLEIALQPDNKKLNITGIKKPFSLSLAICDDGVVCFADGDKGLSIEETARRILEPFLFPEIDDE